MSLKKRKTTVLHINIILPSSPQFEACKVPQLITHQQIFDSDGVAFGAPVMQQVPADAGDFDDPMLDSANMSLAHVGLKLVREG